MSLADSKSLKNPVQAFPLSETDPLWQQIDRKLEEDHLAKVVERQVNKLDDRL